MNLTKNILILLSLVSLISACEKRKPDAKKEQPTAFSKAVAKLPSYREQCNKIKKGIEELCKERGTKNQCLFKNDTNVATAISLLESLPSLSKDHYKLYNEFYDKKETQIEDIGAFFPLVAANCWRSSEYKLWKSLALHKGVTEHKEKLQNLFKEKVTNNTKPPLNMVDLMLKISTLKYATNTVLLKTRKGADIKIKTIAEDAKTKAKKLNRQFSDNLDSLLDSNNIPAPASVEKAYSFLKEEKLTILDYNLKIKTWVDEESK